MKRRLPLAVAYLALAWAALVTLNSFLHLRALGWPVDTAMIPALWPFALGSLIGGAYGVWAASFWGTGKGAIIRFGLFFATVGGATLVMVSLLFYLPFRAYSAQWHGDFLSVEWAFQVFFTGLSAGYLFLATGLPLAVPWIFLLLVLASLAFSRGWLPGSR